ncbi:MAG TPA: N-methyl-L-tryptophan oxidase [Candidatus Binatia bacterium]|nr:N-methyl-L-tryptophan oxidase [Candidatus Binatia bacterium]
MDNKFDTIVIGLGAVGSATVFQLAKRGSRVLGIDQFSPPHHYGSTHGESRIIRQAIGEGAAYTPLALRSYELWRELERHSAKELLTITGGLVLETQQGAATTHGRRNFFDQTVRCAREFNIAHEILETRDLKRRYPQFAITNERGYFEYGAGFLQPELCIQAQLALAKTWGAAIRMNERVVSVDPGASGVTVRTERSVYQAGTVVLAAGAWIARFLQPLNAKHFKVYRQVMYWFRIRDGSQAAFSPKTFPIFIWAFEKGGHIGFYGFPSLDRRSMKVASEQYASTTSPDQVQRTISTEEERSMYRDYIEARLPAVSNRCEAAVVCLYTTTPDADFVIDFHPGSDRILIASPCSGHGFKHSAAVGEVVSELILDGRSKIDIGSFSIDRFLA